MNIKKKDNIDNIYNDMEYKKSRELMCSNERTLNLMYLENQQKMSMNNFEPIFIKHNDRVNSFIKNN